MSEHATMNELIERYGEEILSKREIVFDVHFSHENGKRTVNHLETYVGLESLPLTKEEAEIILLLVQNELIYLQHMNK